MLLLEGRGAQNIYVIDIEHSILGVVLPEERPGILAANAADPYDHYYCRLARSELGQTVVAVWRDLKLEWARELLRETDMTVDEVSRRVGFNSPFYFSTIVKAPSRGAYLDGC